MENFIVSARKYRPDSFQTVVGQDSITRTLKNSIKSRQLAQAYLFCGPRGVGKTTCARIFAKTINCSNLDENLEACNQCESCTAFNEIRSMNIHELDAASNNSVDDIRNLIDQVRIPPQIGNYSVYIIDEVHMLTSSAFNAFLKTLEEPPKHVIFILATTEKHKIIPTILSRCQIFDFNRIQIKDITSRLQFVAQGEGVEAESDALQIIARKADGAMRDALSIFDQIVSFAGKTITYDNTIENLNVLDYEYYFKITNAFLNSDYVESMLIFNEIIEKGFDGNFFISGLASHFRDLLMCKDSKTVELLEVGEQIQKRYLTDASRCSVGFLLNAVKIANECDFKYKASTDKRLHVELALLRIAELNMPNENNEKTVVVAAEQAGIYKRTSVTPPTRESLEKPVESNLNIADKSIEKTEANVDSTAVVEVPVLEDVKENSSVSSNKNIETPQELVRSVSLKNINEQLIANKEIEKKEEEVVIGTDTFDQDALNVLWKKFAIGLEDKSPRLHRMFNAKNPSIVNQSKLLLSVENKGLLDIMQQIIPETQNYLRKGLNNKDISIDVVVDETEMKTKITLTDEERYKEMAKENPSIRKLKDELKLDFK